jgi:hypothetical protein
MQQKYHLQILKLLQKQLQEKEIVLVEMLAVDEEVIEIVHVVWMLRHLNAIEKIDQMLLLIMHIKITTLIIVCFNRFHMR